jgi:hypothetical protein
VAVNRSTDFQVGCVADFQIREPGKALRTLELRRAADLEIGDTAGLETRATGRERSVKEIKKLLLAL